jgi:hypothetical protein
MYHNAALCFGYEVSLLYMINYTVEYDRQLFAIIKTGLTHTFLLVVSGLNQNPAPFVFYQTFPLYC